MGWVGEWGRGGKEKGKTVPVKEIKLPNSPKLYALDGFFGIHKRR